MPSPIALSDSQLDMIIRASRPLQPHQREAFLEAVAQALHGQPIGDGTVYKACREQQRLMFDPPDLTTTGGRKGATSRF
jgi:hypothetical protein